MPAFSIRRSPNERRILHLEINSIDPNPYQPRRCFDPEQLRALADSIREYGLLSPLLVRRSEGGRYELIAGERRLRAMEMLGWSHAEAIITTAFDRDCALMGLIENIQRENLHFLDEAQACRRILREHGITQEELAATLSKSPSALANLLRILKLGRDVRSCIREGGLSERHARCLLRIKDEAEQLVLARRAVQEQLSVRQLEAMIDGSAKKGKTAAKLPDKLIQDNRLVINALKDTVRRLRRIGIAASSRVEAHEDHLDIIVSIHPPQGGTEIKLQ